MLNEYCRNDCIFMFWMQFILVMLAGKLVCLVRAAVDAINSINDNIAMSINHVQSFMLIIFLFFTD